jgi:CRP/FNR family transcriptional regulator
MSAQPVYQPPPESQSELAPALEQLGTAVVSPRGTVVFQQGQQATGLFVLRKGKVRLSRISADGKHLSRTVGAGHSLGLLATVSDQPYMKTAEAIADSELVAVERSRVMSLLDRHADFWLQAVDVIKDEMKLIRKRVTNVSKTSAQSGGGQARTG